MRIIALSNKDWYAEVCADYAMNVIKLTYCGEDVLRPPESLEAFAKRPVVYGTPLLIPPNITDQDKFEFEGKEYSIPYPPRDNGRKNMHGLVRNAPMEIVEVSDTTITGQFFCDADRYPFPFVLQIKCELTVDGLNQTFIVENVGKGNMPLVLGLHTTFIAKSEFTISAGKAWRLNENRLPYELMDIPEEQKSFVTGENPGGRRIHAQFYDSGKHVATVDKYKYVLSENFMNWVVWNDNGLGGFISLEPQSGPINALNMPEHRIVLSPGQKEIFKTTICLK